MNPYLIKTKLSMPQYRDSSVSRPVLIRRLSEGLTQNRQMTLVTAPPGYGKTSLIVEWSQKSEADFVFLALDKGDNEPIRFFSYFIAALQQVDKSIGIAAFSLLDAPQFPPVDMLAGALVNDIAEIPFRIVFILDDFQHINDTTIIEILRYLFENQPKNLHIAIVTRQDPCMPLSRLRAGGLITEIREADLRFSHGEALDFIQKTMNMKLGEEQINQLEAKTEGWVAGLQLAALSILGRDTEAIANFFTNFNGTQRYVIDYLFEEAFEQLPEEIKRFLVQTSILERLSGQLCNELLDRNDCTSVINRIHKANLFISSLDEYGHWYRYHTLFRDILRTELSHEQQKALHFKASAWFEKNGLYDEAVSHAIAAESYDTLERLLSKAAWSLIQNGEIRTLYDWIQALPMDRLKRNNEIRMYLAWCLLLAGKGKEAAVQMNEIDLTELIRYRPEIRANMLVLQIFKAVSFKELAPIKLPEQSAEFENSSDPVVRTAALYCIAQINSFRGRLDDSIRYYGEAFRSALKSNQYFMAMISAKNLSITLLLRGNKTEAVEICSEALGLLVDAKGRLLPAASILYVPLGMAYYSEDNLNKAYECFSKGISVCRKLSLIHFAVQGDMSMALLQFAMHDVEAAHRTIHEASRTLREIGMEMGIPMFTAIEAELYLRSGNLGFARKWAEDMGFANTDMLGILDERQYFTYSRILIAEGRFEEAGKILDRLESAADEGGRAYRLITARILKSVNYFKMNQMDLALESFKNAIVLAAPESYFRLFLDEDACISALLGKVRSLASGFIDVLSEKYRQINQSTSGVKAAPGNSGAVEMIEPLSDRELDVLRLVSEGLPNREIADRLFISLGTTKWHITNIFSKLGVKNRVQAVEAAKSILLK